jgi:MarR family transcriptional regulator, organic hydroperoxide resistance regulator
MLDRMVVLCTMVQVSRMIEPVATMDARTTDDATIESILRALDPMMAYQRKAMLQVWQDKSVSKVHMFVLMLLENHGPLTMSRLAALVDVSLSNLTGIVDRMEQHSLVERVRDDRDRRLVVVRATATGVTRCEEMDGLRREQLRRLVAALDEVDQAVVLHAAHAFDRAVARLNAADVTDSQARPTP